ncbi:hypothetical protein M8C21_028891, partial [Ambrosia artemisiifolia]
MNGANFRIELHKEIDARNAKCLLNEMSHKENIEKPLRHRNLCITPFLSKFSTSSFTWQGLSQKNNAFSNVYVMSLEETSTEMVGEKSCSIRFLNKEGPEWMKFPASIVLPFGVFEKIKGDLSKLNTIQETVLQMKAPRRMAPKVTEVVLKMHLHCEGCAKDVKHCIHKMEGVQTVNPDMEISFVTVKGAFDPKNLVAYISKRLGRHAEIVNSKNTNKKKKDGEQKEEYEKGEKKDKDKDKNPSSPYPNVPP